MLSKRELKELTGRLPTVLDEEDVERLRLIGFEPVMLPSYFFGNHHFYRLLHLGLLTKEYHSGEYYLMLTDEGLSAIGKFRN